MAKNYDVTVEFNRQGETMKELRIVWANSLDEARKQAVQDVCDKYKVSPSVCATVTQVSTFKKYR